MANYGKRPLWQWILIYLIVGGVLYLLIYYFLLDGQIPFGGYSGTSSTPYSY